MPTNITLTSKASLIDLITAVSLRPNTWGRIITSSSLRSFLTSATTSFQDESITLAMLTDLISLGFSLSLSIDESLRASSLTAVPIFSSPSAMKEVLKSMKPKKLTIRAFSPIFSSLPRMSVSSMKKRASLSDPVGVSLHPFFIGSP